MYSGSCGGAGRQGPCQLLFMQQAQKQAVPHAIRSKHILDKHLLQHAHTRQGGVPWTAVGVQSAQGAVPQLHPALYTCVPWTLFGAQICLDAGADAWSGGRACIGGMRVGDA